MSKQQARYDWTWRTLRDLYHQTLNPQTAGQVGKVMGISRNTAKKYLEELIITGTVVRIPVTFVNGQTGCLYNIADPNCND